MASSAAPAGPSAPLVSVCALPCRVRPSAKLARRRGGGVVGGGEGAWSRWRGGGVVGGGEGACWSVAWPACDDVSTSASALCVCDESQELHNSKVTACLKCLCTVTNISKVLRVSLDKLHFTKLNQRLSSGLCTEPLVLLRSRPGV